MRKLTALMTALVVILSGCSKDSGNNAGNDYYFSFQSDNIQYTTAIDSLVQTQISTGASYTYLSMSGSRTQQQTDSAAAGLIKLATWSFTIFNLNSQDTVFTGNYITDSTVGNARMLSAESRFKFYTNSDPHKGQFLCSYTLPFSLTITAWTAASFTGTFQGKVAQYNSTTQVYDTTSITNGKFKLPVHHG